MEYVSHLFSCTWNLTIVGTTTNTQETGATKRIRWRRISTVLTGGPHQKAPSLHSIMLACAISNFQSLHFRGNLDTRSERNFHNPLWHSYITWNSTIVGTTTNTQETGATKRIRWRRISTVLTGGPHQKAPSLHSIMLACAISNFQSLHFRGNLDTRSECNFHNPNARVHMHSGIFFF